MTRKVIIMGAAGRDFHDFNTFFREKEGYEVVAFTAAEGQNLGELEETSYRRYPSSLAGENYPEGVPIVPESELEEYVREENVDEVVLSYSDVSHEEVMHQASRALSAGAGFRILGKEIMLESSVPVIAVDAVRTGSGKSQFSLKIADILDSIGKEVVVVREPMPYGDLEEQRVQRFEEFEDLDQAGVTLEEREEYEQHLERGHVVYSGVDYEDVLEEATEEAEIIVWDGGNNELPFFRPDLHFVLCDPLRQGDETRYHPGEANLRMADYAVINKENTASKEEIKDLEENIGRINSDAEILHADSVIEVEEDLEGRDVLAVEDGPTLTHGDMADGAAAEIAREKGAELVDPRNYLSGTFENIFDRYSHLGKVLPAMGYSEKQIKDLENVINAAEADIVLSGTPIDLSGLVQTDKKILDVSYSIELDADLENILRDQLGEV